MFLFLLFACRSEEGIKVYNSNPEIVITSHLEGAEVSEGYEEIFRAQASDPNHPQEELLVQWLYGEDVVCSWTPLDSTGSSSCAWIIDPQVTQVHAQVQDPEGAAGTSIIQLDIIETQAPTAQILSPEVSGRYYSDQKITFEGKIADTEDTIESLESSWSSDIDGTLDIAAQISSDGDILGYGYLSEGEHAVTLFVEDSTGKTDTASVLIDVGPPNSIPECAITSPVSTSASAQGEFVTFEGSATDADISSSLLTATWSSDKDGELGSSIPNSDGSILFAYSNLSVDVHTITLSVTDEIGALCTSSILLTVGTPPSLQITSPTEGEIYPQDDALLFSAEVSDGQDTPSAISLTWELDGVLFSTQSATSTGVAQFVENTLTAGDHTLIVTAIDGDGLSTSDVRNFSINGIPTAPTITFSPSTAYTEDDITAIATGSVDPEGSAITYSYIWYQNGIQHSNTSATLPASSTQKNDIWKVRITPNDGITDGTASEAEIAINNTAPSITISITPSTSIYNDDTLTCTAIAIDPDESLTPTYSWTYNNTVVSTASTLDLSTLSLAPGESVECTAIVTDSDGASATASSSQLIENRLSNVNTISLAPTSVFTLDTIEATAVLADPDGQSLSALYEWHVIEASTGTDSIVQTGTSSALDGSIHFDRDDSVYVIVTPHDGIDSGTPSTSASITIQNTPPTSASISVTPDPADLGSPLTCSVDIPSEDIDGDTVSYSYEWLDPSGSFVQNTSSLQSSDILASPTSAGLWTCNVTPNDGSIDGNSTSAQATVDDACYSLDFDGVNDTVFIGNTENLFSLSNAFSLCSWVYLDQYPSSATYGS